MDKHAEQFLERIQRDLPSVKILQSEAQKLIYAHSCYPVEYKWILQGSYKYLPGAIVMPTNTEETSGIMKLASELGTKITPMGGGSGIVGGSIPDSSEIFIDLKQLRFFKANTINGTAWVGAGMPGAELEDLLAEQGYTCGQFPQSFQSATLGGMVVTRAVGTFSTKYGKMDDMVNALEVVMPSGEIYRSHSTPKASSGPNLDELFLGSEGVYGLVTGVELNIYPRSHQQYFEAYTFPSTEKGLDSIRKFVQLNIKPAVVRLYDEEESKQKILQYHFEKGYAVLIIGYDGLKEQIRLERQYIRKYCEMNGGLYKGKQPGLDWFTARFSTKKMLDYDARQGGTADAIEVAAPWDCIARVWREMRRALLPLCESVDCHFSHVYHTGASVYVIFHAQASGDDFEGEQRYRECLDHAIRTSIKYGGNISHHHGIGKAKAPYMEQEHGKTGHSIMKKIKTALDPGHILNKGVLGV